MEPDFWTPERVERFTEALAELPGWSAASKHFAGRIRLVSGASEVALDVRTGRTDVDQGGGAADVTVLGSTAEWKRVADGELDFVRAATPGQAGLAVEGDPAFALRNVAVLCLVFEAIARGGGGVPRVEFSPPPPARRSRTVGGYVEVDGLDIYWEEAGQGPAVLCLHAACQDTLMYRHVLAGLSDAYRVIAVDAPGHGKSAMPGGGAFRDLSAHAAFNERLIEALGLERPVIVGCSMAGNVVLELAARRPGAYAAVVSCAGADYTADRSDLLLEMLGINGQQLLEWYARSLVGNRTPPERVSDVV